MSAELYNPELKERFLENYTGQTEVYYRNVFRRAKEKEDYYQKDISRFNRFEYEDFLRSLDSKSIGTLTSKNSVIQKYIEFAIEQNYTDAAYSIRFNKKSLEHYVSKIALEHKYINEEDFMDLVQFCVNDQEKAIFTLLWEGVMGKECYELRHLRMSSDVDKENKILTLTDKDKSTRKIQVSDFTIDIIEKATLEGSYIGNNGEPTSIGLHTESLKNTGYVIRPIEKSANDTITYMGLYRRITTVTEAFGNKFLTANNIRISGMINYAKKLAKDKGTDKLTNSELMKIAHKYNYAKNHIGLSTIRRTLAKNK